MPWSFSKSKRDCVLYDFKGQSGSFPVLTIVRSYNNLTVKAYPRGLGGVSSFVLLWLAMILTYR